jgi:hypothetical protein
MRGPYKLTDDHYLQTSLNTQSKKTRLRGLAEVAGLDIEFLHGWQNDSGGE